MYLDKVIKAINPNLPSVAVEKVWRKLSPKEGRVEKKCAHIEALGIEPGTSCVLGNLSQ